MRVCSGDGPITCLEVLLYFPSDLRALRSREKMDAVLAKYESVRQRVEATRRTLVRAAEKVEKQTHIQEQLGG